MNKLICCCFGYSEADMEQDVINNNGSSVILEKIGASKGMVLADAMRRIPQGNDACLMSTVSWTGQRKD